MKQYSLILFALFITTTTVFAQDTEPGQSELEILESYVVHCEDIEDMKAAQRQGVIVFEYKGRYFVNTGQKYESVKDLETALRLRKQKDLPLPSGKQTRADKQSGAGTSYNPQLMVFPFTSVNEDKQMMFELPEGESIPTAEVMIHPGPYVFESVSYAPIDLYESIKNFAATGAPDAPSPESMPAELRNIKHFAVTGEIAPQPNIENNAGALQYWVGAAVVNARGDVLWKHYGDVEANLGFKVVRTINNPKTMPAMLLMFTLAKGQLEEMLRPIAGIEPMDASGFQYHILGSVAIEVSDNWYPPMEEGTREEYERIMSNLQEKNKARIEK